ncbi:MAG: LptF/LptG family permease [Gemmatimonadota bacterium]|jgi:lipopolysaccharide export system permease protein|nr:LptF/LptG family permease [Gemmatimonadota bacterium]
MKIIDRYIYRQFFSTFTVLLLGLPVIFIITDLTDQLDKYLNRGLSAGQVALSYVYFLPQLIFWGFPIASLIATVFTIGNMTRYQEITAAKAGGVSFYRLAAPLVLCAVVLSIVGVGIGDLVPVANQKRAVTIGERQRSISVLRNNIVFRTESGRTLAANRVSSLTSEMERVVVETAPAENGMRHQVAAGSALFYPDRGWVLSSGYFRWIVPGEVPRVMDFGAMEIRELQDRPEEILTVSKDAEEMTYRELERFVRTVERSGGNSNEYRVDLAQKLSLPLAIFVIVLFGAPLATSSQRGGAAFGIGVSLIITLIYLMMFRVGKAVGASGAVDPMVAAWAPNVIFLVGGIILFWRVKT